MVRKEGWLRVAVAKVAWPVEEVRVLVSVQRMLQQVRVRASFAEEILVWAGFAPDSGTAVDPVRTALLMPLRALISRAYVS